MKLVFVKLFVFMHHPFLYSGPHIDPTVDIVDFICYCHCFRGIWLHSCINGCLLYYILIVKFTLFLMMRCAILRSKLPTSVILAFSNVYKDQYSYFLKYIYLKMNYASRYL